MTSPHQPQDQRDRGADQHRDGDAASGSVEAHGSPVIAARWQPIETAPKDRPILLAPSIWNGRSCDIGKWDDQKYQRNPKPYWRRDSSVSVARDRAHPPIHWMPLPAPPGDA